MARRLSDAHAKLAINIERTVGREEFLDHMTFKANRRPLFTEIFGPLIGLKDEWAAQGATAGELDLSAYQWRCPAYGHLPVNTGFAGGCEEEILEETEDHLIGRDAMGRTVKLSKKCSTIALPMTHPVRNMDDWRAYKHHYEFNGGRFGDGWEMAAREHLAAGRVVCVGIPGGYNTPRELMGDEEACIAFIEQPELIHDILKTVGDTAEKVLNRVSRSVAIDKVTVHEDMAGRSGPMIGPAHVREFIKPYYRRIWDMLAARGCRLFDQDSDGNMNPVIEAFLECGLNMMHPFEPAAGMDMVATRRKYGKRLAIMGGIDKHVLRRGEEAITAELEYKIPPMVASGGCMLGLDHRIPNGTPLAAYRFYVRKAWEIMDREAAELHY